MTVLNGHEIKKYIQEENLVSGYRESAINAASLDIHLGVTILKEIAPPELRAGRRKIISLAKRDKLVMETVNISEESYVLRPGEFILAQSVEIFNLPKYISAEYKLKSSMARIGLEHLNAGWCDAGWNGSVLTLELRNMTTYHDIEICCGDAIGQMIFYRHHPVAPSINYATKGNYNGHLLATQTNFKPLLPGEE